MTALAVEIRKNVGTPNGKTLHERVVHELMRPLNGARVSTINSDRVAATKLWLPHSRTQGICRDRASGSWLACVGNPFGEKLKRCFGVAFTQPLLEEYLRCGIEAVTSLSAPFATIIYDGRDDVVHVVTDRVGLQHMYVAELPESYVLSSSSLAIALAMNVHLDVEAVSTFFMVGYLLGQDTFFEEVHKINAATWMKIQGERMQAERYWTPPSEERPGSSLADYTSELAGLFQQAVTDRLVDDGRTSVELTSGIDSRLNLACAANSGRKFHAWTIGESDSPEVRVARELKEVQDFDHHVVSAVADLPETFLDDLGLISTLTDSETNCLNLISSPSCNRRSATYRDAALSGLAGEILRGSYYVYYKGVPNIMRNVNVERIMRFKTLCNSWPKTGLFSGLFPRDYLDIVKRMINQYFTPTAGQPLRWRLDHYYYSAAVHRFVGRSCSFNNSFYRQALPYFDNRVIDISFRLPHRFKAAGKVMRSALAVIHPRWSDVALENGLPARPMGVQDLSRLTRYYYRCGLKALGKISSSIIRQRRTKKDNAGVYDVVTQSLQEEQVRLLMTPANMASEFLYDSDGLREYIDVNTRASFPDRVQIGLILSFELLCRQIGSNLRV